MKKQLTVLLPLIMTSLVAGCLTATATPLTDAAEKGDVEAVRKLIAKGADVNAKGARSKGYPTPLYLAAEHGNKEIAELLIAKGADVNAKDFLSQTPLHMAAGIGHKDVVELLIANGADVSITQFDGKTPRMYAEGKGYTEIAGILKEAEEQGPRRVESAQADPQEEAKFVKAAKDYHDAATKPTIPEEARKFKVQAEQSVGDKKFDAAAELYGKALAIAPWWPEGHFNRAIVLGENRYYQGAMREMKRYLILVPNAPDARAAQDKIYAWELKAGK